MKYKVQLWVSGKIFDDEVYANNVQEAKETAKNRNPYAKVISVNATFF